jgi:hypothetical protein
VELDGSTQQGRNCTLPGFDDATWTGGELFQIHLGLPTRWDWEGDDHHKDFMAPAEDIQGEGCPGGWHRCGFVASLHKYRRKGSEQKTENLLLTRCTDRLVLEAIAYLEDEEGHALGAFYEARDSDG